MGPERKFRNKITPILKALPGSWWESIQQVSIRGTPDILGCVNGTFVALELKGPAGKLAPMQEHKLKKITEAGGFATVVYPATFDSILLKLKEL